MPMTYLRKTGTYTVERADGQQLLVDEFESEEHPGRRRPVASTSRRFLARNGDRANFIDESTLELVKTGERLTVIGRDRDAE